MKARFSSKFDLNQGYNQLELEPSSRYITTVSTHVGLFRYKRLNFGISSAAEVFHYTIRDVLNGLKGVINISDDILVFGRTRLEHDQNLHACCQRLCENGLTLNHDKCSYNKESLDFFGNTFSKGGLSADKKIRRKYKYANFNKPNEGAQSACDGRLLFSVHSWIFDNN